MDHDLDKLAKLVTSLEKAGESAAKFTTKAGGLNKLSGYQQNKDKKGGGGKSNKSSSTQVGPCSGCGSKAHTDEQRREKCGTWGKTCSKCGRLNHAASVCKSRPKKKPERKEDKKAAANEVKMDNNTEELAS